MSPEPSNDAEVGRSAHRHGADEPATDQHSTEPGAGPVDEVEAEPFDARRAREFRRAVLRKSVRHSRARRERRTTVWSYLGVFGLVGWTVAVPALLGLALGLYLDGVWETTHSFTITFLVVGVSVGCAMAWYWIRHESQDP